MRRLRHALKSRTIWFAMLLSVLSVLQGFVFDIPFSPVIQAIIGSVIAVVVVILRCITVEPLYDK